MKVQTLDSGCQVTANGDSRVTPIGRFLRRNKLDELPQLINVFVGHMALVGPRPEVPEFAELFPSEFQRILTVRPGITHPVTLFFRREEEILAATKNPREFYIRKVLPEKLAAYESNLQQSLLGNFRTIAETLVPSRIIKPYGPEHFAPEGALGIMPFPTSGESISAFPAIANERKSAAGGSSISEETLVAKAANSTSFPN